MGVTFRSHSVGTVWKCLDNYDRLQSLGKTRGSAPTKATSPSNTSCSGHPPWCF